MDKNALFDKITIKAGWTREQFDKKWDEERSEFKQRGHPEQELDGLTLRKLNMFFAVMFMGSAEPFTGYVLGITDVTDFGAKKRFEEATNLFKTNPDRAKKEGFVNEHGEPVHKWGSPAQPIDPTNDFEAEKRFSVIMLARQNTDTAKKIKRTTLTLPSKAQRPTPFTMVEFAANIGKKSDELNYLLNGNNNTQFRTTGVQPAFEKMVPALKECFPEALVELSNLDAWIDKYGSNINRLALIKCDVAEVNYTRESARSNAILLNDDKKEFNLEQPDFITGWVPKSIPMDCTPGAMGVIIAGQPSRNTTTGVISINVYGLLVPENARTKKGVKPIQDVPADEIF